MNSKRVQLRHWLLIIGALCLYAGLMTPQVAAAPATIPSPLVVSSTTGGSTILAAVPAGICAVDVVAVGGGGGGSFANNGTFPPLATNRGGDGAIVEAIIPAHPTQNVSGSVGGGGGASDGAGAPGGFGVHGSGGDGGSNSDPTRNTHTGAGGGGLSAVFIGDLANPVVVAGGGGGSGGGHAGLIGQNGGDAGVVAAAGAVAAGTDGLEGRDLARNAPPAVSLPGGQGGQAGAPGAGGMHPGSTDLLDTNDYSVLDGSAGVARDGGDGGASEAIAVASSKDGSGGGGAGFFGGGGGVGTADNGSGGTRNPIDDRGIGGSGGGGGASFLIGAAFDGVGTAPTLRSSASAENGRRQNPATLDVSGSGGDGSVTVTWVPCDYDLTIAKTATPTSAKVGETVTWRLEVTNNGPDHMTLGDTVSITDAVPGANAATISSISTGGSPTPSGLDTGAFTCDAAVGSPMPASLECSRPYAASAAAGVSPAGTRGLDVGETLIIEFTQVLADADQPSLTNNAAVIDRAGESVASATVSVLPLVPSISLDKVVDTVVDNGDGTYEVTYTLTATNTGDVTLDPVEITDSVAGTWGAAFSSAAVTGGTCTPAAGFDGDVNPIAVDAQILASMANCTVQITASLDVTGTGSAYVNTPITNNADVSGQPPTGATETASASAETTLPETPVIGLAKVVSSGPTAPASGISDIQYTLTVSNEGGYDLSSVSVTDDLSAVWGVALQPTPTTSGTCSLDGTYTGSPGTIELLAGQTLSVGESCTIIIDLQVDVSDAGDPALADVAQTNNAQASATGPSAASAVTADANVDATVPAPTPEPTVEPTVEPTTEPTVEPTVEPTTEPTVEPTTEPTVEPTVEPTTEPTVEPTTEPTVFRPAPPRGVFDAAAAAAEDAAAAGEQAVQAVAADPAAAADDAAQPSTTLAATGIESQILTYAGLVFLGAGACMAAGERRRRRLDGR